MKIIKKFFYKKYRKIMGFFSNTTRLLFLTAPFSINYLNEYTKEKKLIQDFYEKLKNTEEYSKIDRIHGSLGVFKNNQGLFGINVIDVDGVNRDISFIVNQVHYIWFYNPNIIVDTNSKYINLKPIDDGELSPNGYKYKLASYVLCFLGFFKYRLRI
jgi:hypothetical protein